jgi:hypothetical protein
MKKITSFATIGILLLSIMILFTDCKKKKDDPIVPAFIVTATTVQLQGGGDGLQFAAKCTNDDVKMTKVLITDPIQNQAITYNLNGVYFVKNEIFTLQAENTAYLLQKGTWTFIFIGNRTSDGTSFASTATLAAK